MEITNKKRLRDELIVGRDSAKKLQNLLRRKVGDVGSSFPVDDLVMVIKRSFSEGLLMLGSCDSGDSCRIPSSFQTGGVPCSSDRTSDEKGKKPAPAVKDPQGCYKRRKTIDSKIKIVSSIEDGYAWRKYGQKAILNAKFPRCYFRCTHKISHGCKAVKQVQQLEDEPNMFHITYFGHHTCQNIHPTMASPSIYAYSQITPSEKQEVDSKTQSEYIADNVSSMSYVPSSPVLWKEVQNGGFDQCHELTSTMGFDGDSSSSSYLDIDLMENVGFLNDFQFE